MWSPSTSDPGGCSAPRRAGERSAALSLFKMEEKKTSPLYKLIKGLVRLFYPETAVSGKEKLPPEPVVFVGNHAQMNGPIVSELYLPSPHYTWCAGQMMHLKEVPAYAYQDFWSGKPRSVRWLYRILSYLIAPLSVCVFNNADTVPVYRDARIITTFRESMGRLEEGASLVIFPEHLKRHNNIVYEFQDKFIDLARMYHKRTGRALAFVPLYVAPALGTAFLGDPIRYDPAAPKTEERRRICQALMDAVTDLAAGLPRHTVVPYANLPKKDYPFNLPLEVYEEHEEDTL